MKVIILTEGGKKIGFGHISRCLSLYEAFRKIRITPEFIINSDDSVKVILKNRKFRCCDWLKDNSVLDSLRNADIAIIDSYQAKEESYRKVSGAVRLGVYLDDFSRINYPPGIVLNGNINARDVKYPERNGVRYLLGTRYAPLRKEFWSIKTHKPGKRFSTLTLTLGGNDIRQLNYRVLKLLVNKFPEMTKQLVLGCNNQARNKLNAIKDKRTKFFMGIDAFVLRKLLAGSDVAISAGGQTTNELARLGIPAISLAVADNQLGIVKGWAKAGSLIYAGKWNEPGLLNKIENGLMKLKNDPRLRSKMSCRGKTLIDGKGSARAVKAILKELKAARKETRIIFLSNNPVSRPLIRWLREESKESVHLLERPVSLKDIENFKPDFLISYNYRHIVGRDVLARLKDRAINLHTSFLPWNRGAHPNLWSFLENSPKGVTIHVMAPGIDTGDILVQKKVKLQEGKETLASSYNKLHRQIQGLFIDNWPRFKKLQIKPEPQTGKGSSHLVRDFARIKPLIGKAGWGMKISDLKKRLREVSDER